MEAFAQTKDRQIMAYSPYLACCHFFINKVLLEQAVSIHLSNVYGGFRSITTELRWVVEKGIVNQHKVWNNLLLGAFQKMFANLGL